MNNTLFHLAYHVRDLDVARKFYGDILGCREGRSTATWVDFDFFGHQLSLHLGEPFATTRTGFVDGHKVPMPHLGAVMPIAEWQKVSDRLLADASVEFVFKPMVRYANKPAEQWIVFVLDFDGNPIELKSFKDVTELYLK